jgi:hypothetical protein
MIDRWLYKFFGLIDNWFNWVDSHFIKSKKKKKRKHTSPDDLFNGE